MEDYLLYSKPIHLSVALMKCLHSNITLVWHQISGLLLLSCPVVSNSLLPHGLQHTRPPCPSASPRVYRSSCSLDQWCCPAISSSDAFLSSGPQFFPESGTFLMSRLFTSDDQNTGASSPVFPTSIQGWFPLRLTGLISLLSKGLSEVFSSTTFWRHQFSGILHSSLFKLSQQHVTIGKTITLTIQTITCNFCIICFS